MLRWQVASDDGGQPALFPHEDGWQPGRGELAGLELLYVRARRAINRVPEQSRQPFRWTVNPYRGCSHACVYCFARPTHEYLGLGIGDDFDRRLVVARHDVVPQEPCEPCGWRLAIEASVGSMVIVEPHP